MEYQLVIQFAGDSSADLDSMVELEEVLAEALDDIAEVDGHDVGSGEINIFILTSDPVATFSRAKPTLKKFKYLHAATAAYREIDGENYTVIWPEGSRQKFTVS